MAVCSHKRLELPTIHSELGINKMVYSWKFQQGQSTKPFHLETKLIEFSLFLSFFFLVKTKVLIFRNFFKVELYGILALFLAKQNF